MHELAFLAGLEALLLVVGIVHLRKNRQLLQEIRRCQFDLALALSLARQSRFEEAHAAARRWAVRLRALRNGRPPPRTYRPPSDEIMRLQ